MKNWVALIMALTVLVILTPGSVLPLIRERTVPVTAEEIQLFRDVLLVLIGALSGYIGNSKQS